MASPPQGQQGQHAAEPQFAEAIGEWRRDRVVGRGAHGTVYLGIVAGTGAHIAVKQISIVDISESDLRAVAAEINLVRRAEHPYIVRYLGAEVSSSDPGFFDIFLEFVEGGSLRSHIRTHGPLAADKIAVFTRQMLLGLHYLHSSGISHRDIKGANVLVDAELECVKLADFSDAKHVSSNSLISGIKGTPHWMAPEVIRGDLSAHGWVRADIWSVGCTVLEMATAQTPWRDLPNPIAAMYHIANTKVSPPLPEDMDPLLQAFICAACQVVPKRRPSALELLSHPFILQHCPPLDQAEIIVPPPDLCATPNLNLEPLGDVYRSISNGSTH
eukprot:CAMPEP_0118861642 /NCGR_PEP_ID=MMETSP1163-20130328/7109_1 /TAXON_ID=124430 /ORGANISM="Phaeomonas parva, Strain CCMP2877" /LENGTH=328 /DNA_ID=CAMNT_0006795473 /DNA_START=376 /DNA_END=1359 /DNA_ORIENTATION=+